MFYLSLIAQFINVITDIGVSDSNNAQEEMSSLKCENPADTLDSKEDMKINQPRDRATRLRKKKRISVIHRKSGRTSFAKVIVISRQSIDPKPFKCLVGGCTYAVARKHYLTKHMQKHAKEKTFVCEMCPKNFNEQTALDEHIHEHNAKKSTFVCSTCDTNFDTERKRNAHVRKCK